MDSQSGQTESQIQLREREKITFKPNIKINWIVSILLENTKTDQHIIVGWQRELNSTQLSPWWVNPLTWVDMTRRVIIFLYFLGYTLLYMSLLNFLRSYSSCSLWDEIHLLRWPLVTWGGRGDGIYPQPSDYFNWMFDILSEPLFKFCRLTSCSPWDSPVSSMDCQLFLWVL